MTQDNFRNNADMHDDLFNVEGPHAELVGALIDMLDSGHPVSDVKEQVRLTFVRASLQGAEKMLDILLYGNHLALVLKRDDKFLQDGIPKLENDIQELRHVIGYTARRIHYLKEKSPQLDLI